MPYCSIEEAWGINLSDNNPLNPDIGTNTIDKKNSTRNYNTLTNMNGTNRYIRNKDNLELTLEDQPIVEKEKPLEKPQLRPCKEQRKAQSIERPVVVSEEEVVEGFTSEKINAILNENNNLKALINKITSEKKNTENQELLLFIVMGVFLIYIFDLFIRMGRK